MRALIMLIAVALLAGCAAQALPKGFSELVFTPPNDDMRIRIAVTRSCDEFAQGFHGESLDILKWFHPAQPIREYRDGDKEVRAYGYGANTIYFFITKGKIVAAKCTNMLLTMDEGGVLWAKPQ